MLDVIRIGSFVRDAISPKRLFISNFFHASFDKTVLISYITQPFISGLTFGHSNGAEVMEIARVFHEKKYQVDIIRYNGNFDSVHFKKIKYDVVFGLEPNFLKAVKFFWPKVSIYYATGAHYLFQNTAEANRLADLEDRTGVRLLPRRMVQPHESSDTADAVVCIGNEWTRSTYLNHSKKIESVRISAFSFFPFEMIENMKNWEESKRGFLWFGSSGAVHKGLDILLEIFREQRDLHLYICGNVRSEKDFMTLYKKELFEYSNIHLIGWIDPSSEKFLEIIKKCAFSILPSCSEGMSGTIATCMHSGLIPLVSKESGVDIQDYGIVFSDNSIETIRKNILFAAQLNISFLREQSRNSFLFASQNFTLEKFSSDFKMALEKIL